MLAYVFTVRHLVICKTLQLFPQSIIIGKLALSINDNINIIISI